VVLFFFCVFAYTKFILN